MTDPDEHDRPLPPEIRQRDRLTGRAFEDQSAQVPAELHFIPHAEILLCACGLSEPRVRGGFDQSERYIRRCSLDFDPVGHARSKLIPFLNAILTLLEGEDQPEQEAFFSAIRRAIESAREPADLADPFIQLSMSAFLGFRFDSSVAMVLDQLLMHSQQLTEVLSLEDREIN